MTGAIRSVTNISTNDVTVNQKYKSSANDNKVSWWFVLRGEEDTLQRLEEAWQQIAIQTEWKLELQSTTGGSEGTALNPELPTMLGETQTIHIL